VLSGDRPIAEMLSPRFRASVQRLQQRVQWHDTGVCDARGSGRGSKKSGGRVARNVYRR
jgi:hypothetical protein